MFCSPASKFFPFSLWNVCTQHLLPFFTDTLRFLSLQVQLLWGRKEENPNACSWVQCAAEMEWGYKSKTEEVWWWWREENKEKEDCRKRKGQQKYIYEEKGNNEGNRSVWRGMGEWQSGRNGGKRQREKAIETQGLTKTGNNRSKVVKSKKKGKRETES